MEDKYLNNIGELFSIENQREMLERTFVILGCGGQGGYIADFLCRLGVKEIILYDGDVFEESNLNRQLGATEDTLGKNKAEIISKYLQSISYNTNIIYYPRYFGENEDFNICLNVNFIFDEMDYSKNYKNAREILKRLIYRGIPVIYGKNYLLGSLTSIYTKKNLNLFDIDTSNIINNRKIEKIAQPAYLCAATASIQLMAMVKYFTNQKYCPTEEIFYYDFYHNKIKIKDQFGEYY